MSPSEHHFQVTQAEHYHFFPRSVFPKAHRVTRQETPTKKWLCEIMGRINSKEQPEHLLLTFCVLNTLVPTLHTSRPLSGQLGQGGWRAAGKKKTSAPAGEGLVGKQPERQRESEPRLCRQAWAKGMSPTCATSSPSFKYRIGAGWAGTQFSLLQPQTNAPFPRPSRRFPRSLSEETECGTLVPSRGGLGDRGADRDPPPVRSAAPSPGRVGSRMLPTCQQARSGPLPAPPAASKPRSCGRRPPPSPRCQQLCRARRLLQGFVRTAESRA